MTRRLRLALVVVLATALASLVPSTPTRSQAATLPAFTSVAAGGQHTCALAADRTVWCWGQNVFGQLGDGSRTAQAYPVQVAGLTNVVSLALGEQHSCALDATGTLFCWGRNRYGETGVRGLRQRADVLEPTAVKLTPKVKAAAAGSKHTCALLTDSTVWCWGFNAFGQLGNGRTKTAWGPMKTYKLPAASSVAAGAMHTCAIVSGTPWCWGQNQNRQLALAGTSTAIPTKTTGLANATALALGSHHTCVLASSAVSCIGREAEQQTGTELASTAPSTTVKGAPTTTAPKKAASFTPLWRKVEGASPASLIASRHNTTCAIVSGEVVCWGSNRTGELGAGRAVLSSLPVKVKSLSGVSSLALGAEHVCALRGTEVLCWGSGAFGQLGRGLIRRADTPAPITAS